MPVANNEGDFPHMLSKDFDVIVVGAGPAGSIAALHAAKSGANTALLDKEALPREKLCGGGVNAWVIRKLGIPESIIERTMNQVQVVAGEKKLPLVPWPDFLAWRMVMRDRFDYHLTKTAIEAGATLIDSTPVRSVVLDEKGKVCGVRTRNKGELRCKVVIGCDGVASTIAKTAGFWAKWFDNDVHKWLGRSAYCAEAQYKLPEKEIERRLGNTSYVFYERDLMGYHWIFPKKGLLTVGTGCATTYSRKKPTSYFNDFVRGNPIAREILKDTEVVGKLKGAYVPYSGTYTPSYGDGVLLAGDSAGMVGGVTGEGIFFAVRAGIAAGEIASKAAESNNISAQFLSRYERRWQKEIGKHLDAQVRFLGRTQNPLIAMGLYTTYTLRHQKELFP
jgi:geranylgeranyl reductase family protein